MASQNPNSRKRKLPQQHSSKPLSHRPMKDKKKSTKPKLSKSTNPNRIPLGKNNLLANTKKTENPPKKEKKKKEKGSDEVDRGTSLLSTAPSSQQLNFFLDRFQSDNRLKFSPLELEAFKDTCMIELPQGMDQDVTNFSEHMKVIFRTSWREELCDGMVSEGTIDVGSPALIVISTSALRSLELLRGLKPFTTECRPVKLFAKHMKVEEQLTMLKTRVNIASGTPSRIKKLIDMEALSLSRLAVVVLDMHQDAKGYNLLTLPQVSAEFWDLYKNYVQPRLLEGDTQICFYGPVPNLEIKKATKRDEEQ